jgi:hypothetical protein
MQSQTLKVGIINEFVTDVGCTIEAVLLKDGLVDGVDIFNLNSAVSTNTTDISNRLPLSGGTMTGAILHSSGSAAAPSITFGSDNEHGFYYDADGIGFSAYAQERLTISNLAMNTTINIIPTIDNTYNLGASNRRFQYVYANVLRGSTVHAGNGTESLPGLSFATHSSWGLYEFDAVTMGLSVQGSGSMLFDATTNFSIKNFQPYSTGINLGTSSVPWDEIHGDTVFVDTGLVTTPSLSFGNNTGIYSHVLHSVSFTCYSNLVGYFDTGGLLVYGRITSDTLNCLNLLPNSATSDIGSTSSPFDDGYFNRVLVGNGTEAAPSHSFDGTTNMGMYRRNSASLGLCVGGGS